MRIPNRALRIVGFAVLLACAGCTTIARIGNFQEPACQSSFVGAVSAILVSQGEKPDVADTLATRTVSMLQRVDIGPRPFPVSSPSGTDYEFFVQLKKSRCLLRLYGRQKGFTSYTNNITYIATRELTSCACAE